MLVFKLIASVILNVGIFALLLFVPAGTLQWPRAWIFLGVVLIASLVTMLAIFPGNEALLNERFKPPIQKGQPLADKILIVTLLATFLSVVVFIPLDVFRLHLTGRPGIVVSSLGLAVFVAGWWIIASGLKANAFAAPVVRHQTERPQAVADTGVYAIVRHPMYAGGVLVTVGMPLWLESYAAALMGTAVVATLVLRIVFEEKFLKKELRGYDAYTKRVRYRLIPFLW